MRTRIILAAALAAVTSAGAQTPAPITRGPLPATARVLFDAPANVLTPAEAQGFEYRFYIGGTPAAALTSVTCTAPANAGGPIPCASPLSASNRDALNRIGIHQVTLSAFRQDVGEGPQSAPFTLTSPAAAPTGLRLSQ